MDRTILLLLTALILVLFLIATDAPSLLFRHQAPEEVLEQNPQSPTVVSEAQDAPLPEPVPEEEVPHIESAVEESVTRTLASSTFLAIRDSCGPYFNGTCVNIRSGPSTTTSRILLARNGMVLPVDETLTHDGRTWYRIVFSEWLRYSERVTGPWYIAQEYGDILKAPQSEEFIPDVTPTTTKRIVVDRSDQSLTAYDGDELFMEEKISTGLDLTPTPRGTFTVFRKTPSRYMQGPLPGISDDYYDLPGVPWNLYFTAGGGAIHGTYWHDHFGTQWSHGCVNLPTDKARILYEWAPLGTTVIVRD